MLGRKWHSGTSKTKAGQGGLVRVALFWKSHCVTCSPACVILYHVTGRAKGLFMPKPVACTHWVFLIVEKLYLETGHNKLPPAQRAILFCPKVPPRFLSWPVLWAWASGCLCLYYDSVNGVPLSFQAIKEKKACKRSFFSFGKLLKFVLLLLVAAVAIDIYKHKGYKGKMLLVCFPLCEVFGRCSLHFQVLSGIEI